MAPENMRGSQHNTPLCIRQHTFSKNNYFNVLRPPHPKRPDTYGCNSLHSSPIIPRIYSWEHRTGLVPSPAPPSTPSRSSREAARTSPAEAPLAAFRSSPFPPRPPRRWPATPPPSATGLLPDPPQSDRPRLSSRRHPRSQACCYYLRSCSQDLRVGQRRQQPDPASSTLPFFLVSVLLLLGALCWTATGEAGRRRCRCCHCCYRCWSPPLPKRPSGELGRRAAWASACYVFPGDC